MSVPHRLQKFCISLTVFLPTLLWCQANVDESLESASIYVNGTTGSDSNPGTESQPLQTISAAANMAENNNYAKVGSKVIIEPGTYRESITMGKNFRTTAMPITFSAATAGTVTISGAEVWTGWAPYSGNSSIYTLAWPYQWGECAPSPTGPTQQPIVLRQEMIFVNGAPLTEVLSLASMEAGTFFPDEANGTVYIWPPAGTDISTATVEVSTRPALFTDIGQSYVVLRGLNFQYANSCRMASSVFIENNATNVLIDSDTFQWNNATGLGMTTPQNYTVQNSTANHNGQAGMTSYQVKYGMWQSDTANFNNWRGAQGAFYSWDAAGFHFMLDHNGTFKDLTALYNQTFPVHFDTDNANVNLNSATAVGNVNGLLLEKSEGPMTIAGVNLCGNAPVYYPNNAGGLILRDSTSLSFTGNSIYNNGVNAITSSGELGGIAVTNWETGQVYQLITQNVTFSGNQFAGSSTAQVFSDGLANPDWNIFTSTLSSGHNVWWAEDNTNAYTVPDPKPGTLLDFSGWQSATGQDLTSSWSSVTSPAACEVSSGSPDFMLVPGNVDAWVVSPAGAASGNLTAVSLGDMAGEIRLSVQGLSAIPGATASFQPASIGTSGTSVLTITTGHNTPPGTYTFTVLGNVGSDTHSVTLSLTIPTTSVRLSTTSLTFPGQGVDTTSNAQTVALTNIGSSAISIGSIKPTYSFGETNNCGASLKAGASCTISVTFSPHLTGALNGTLTIQDSDPTSPQIVTLSGTGDASAEASVSSTLLGFGLQSLGSKSTLTTHLDNKGGASLSISSIKITGTNAADFSQTNNCGSSVAAGGSCEIEVAFSPSQSGKDTAKLTVADNSSSGSQVVTLQGSGK
jgi:hypothetical protein